MAEWQRKSIADGGTFSEIAEQGKAAITTVQSVLKIVQGGANVAKLFLTGIANPAAVAAALLADALIATLNNYRESGFFLLFINPFDDTYGQQLTSQYGLEFLTDENGLVQFKSSTVFPFLESPFRGQTFEVNDEYRRTLNLQDLTSSYRDKFGRNKTQDGFVPPTPRIVNPPKLVLGGFDPATWRGDFKEFSYFPQLSADKTINLMADAFDDEGDVPKYLVTNPKITSFGDGPEAGSSVPFTALGTPIETYDPHKTFKFPLYRSANTAETLSARGEITKRISFGKPNFQGDTTLTGQTVTAFALIIAAQDPRDFLDSLKNLQKFLPGLPDLQNLLDALNKLLTPDEQKVTLRVDENYGGFKKDDLIKGFSSGAVGKVSEVKELAVPQINVTEYEYEFSPYDSSELTAINKTTINANDPIRYRDYEITYAPLGDPTNRFQPNEEVYEAEIVTRTSGDTEFISYRIKGIEFKQNFLDADLIKKPIDKSKLPRYGVVRGINAVAPNSTPPDFISIKPGEMIPGWNEFFDGLVELANGIKGFAEDTSAFIQALIETIDDLLDKFTKLVNALVKLIELLTIGLPNAGIWYLGMETTNGNAGIQSGLRSAGNAPDETYKFSAGLLLVGDPLVTKINQQAFGLGDPLKSVFEPLGVEFQSV